MIRARLIPLSQVLRFEHHGKDAEFSGVSTDTRQLVEGNLFVAIKGERVDGHDYLDAAMKAGAVAALVSQRVDHKLPQLVCHNSEAGLGRMASWYRSQLRARIAGITGSNGKTTVKTLAAGILARVGKTVATHGNLNNEIGLPLTLLAMSRDTEFGVLEMGAGKPGDIDYLARIARPHAGLVNNIAPAHLERMGSVKGVAETKGALYANLTEDGIAIINSDEPFASYFAHRAGARRQLRFGLGGVSQISAEVRSIGLVSDFELVTPVGRANILLQLPGKHNVHNALAAASVALALGAPLAAIAEGLNAATPVEGRLHRHTLKNDSILIDDSYNANPGSTTAAIRTLALLEGQRVLVLGDMRELGDNGAELTRDIGALAKREGIQQLLGVGELSAHAVKAFGEGGHWFETQDALTQALLPLLKEGAHALVKGSRGSRMDVVVDAVLKQFGAASAKGKAHAA